MTQYSTFPTYKYQKQCIGLASLCTLPSSTYNPNTHTHTPHTHTHTPHTHTHTHTHTIHTSYTHTLIHTMVQAWL